MTAATRRACVLAAAAALLGCGGSPPESPAGEAGDSEVAAIDSPAAAGPSSGATPPAEAHLPGLERVAVLDGFDVPETALYDAAADLFLVSNVQGQGAARDGGGFVSRVAPDGTLVDARFIAGGERGVTLHGPKGMALRGDTLWVVDVDALRAFDRVTGAPLAAVDLSAAGAVFPNDVEAHPDGSLYVTDSGLEFGEGGAPRHVGPDRVFRIAPDGTVTAVLEEALGAPNGIEWDASAHRFLVGPLNGASLLAWSPGDAAVAPLGEGPGGFDGIEILAPDSILVTSLDDGAVHLFTAGRFEPVLGGLPGPANLGLDPRRRLIAVPLLEAGRLELWRLPGGS